MMQYELPLSFAVKSEKDKMSNEVILGYVRQVLLFGGGFAVAKGWVTEDNLVAIVGGVLAIGTAVWATFKNKKLEAVKTENAELKDQVKVSG